MAYKAKMQGNPDLCQTYTEKALRLQGSLTKTTPIAPPPLEKDGMPTRGDFFHLKMHRREEEKNLDLSKTFKFKN